MVIHHFLETRSHECVTRKPVFRCPTRSDTNWAVQAQKLASSLKFRKWTRIVLHVCIENKGPDQLLIS